MTISWDQNQLPALSFFLEEKLPLLTGEVAVVAGDIPANCFACSVDLEGREFTVYSSSESSVSDLTINVFLGYVVALAYDRQGWTGLPPLETLNDCHREVCLALLDFNEEAARALEEHAELIEEWHRTHLTMSSGIEPEGEQKQTLEDLTKGLFNPPNSKNYGAN